MIKRDTIEDREKASVMNKQVRKRDDKDKPNQTEKDNNNGTEPGTAERNE